MTNISMPHTDDDAHANNVCYSDSNKMQVAISMAGKWIFQNPNYTRELQKNPLFYVYSVIDNRFHHHPDHHDSSGKGIWSTFLPHILATIVVFVVVSRILHFSLRYLKQPLIVSQLIVGMMISFLSKQSLIFKPEILRVEFVMALVSALFNLFVVGVKFDFSRTLEVGRKKPVIIGLSNQLTTLLVGYLVYHFLNKGTVSFGGDKGAFMLYLLQPCTSTYTVSMMDILGEYGLLNSELGRLALSSTMIQFVTQYIFFIVLVVPKQLKIVAIKTVLSITVLFALIILLIRPYALWIVRSTPPNRRVRNMHMISIMLTVVFVASMADIVGLIYLAAPVLMGLILPTGPPLGTALIKQLDLVATELLFATVFMAEGYYMDWTQLKAKQSLVLGVLLMVILTSFTKMVCSIVSARYCEMTLKDGVILGLMMNFRGLIDILYYMFLTNQNLLDATVCTVMVLSTSAILIICVPLVVVYYKPLRARKKGGPTVQNICSDSPQDELHVMVCFYDEKPIPALLDFLESLSPIETSHNSICIYPIHIVELQGRGESDLIWHCNKTGTINYSAEMEYSIHNHFITFEQSKKCGVTVMPFTSLTPLKTMHQDVCSLILNKDISFVIVPFPKKNSMASLEGDAAMHELVPLVLQQASCSVGIMVHSDRGRKMISECCEYQIGVIFFGGPDDRESIAIASNLVRHPSIYLSVLCFNVASMVKIDPNQQPNDDVKEMSDNNKAISELQAANAAHNRVSIKKIIVGNMEQAFPIMQGLGHKCDLLIVGRRQEHLLMKKSDLEKWIDSPSLGVIGDILAADVSCIANLLIVQQYIS